ncbi:Uncharacterized FCP1 homology domain-containing protein C1271.03c [Linum grandiflorum]
MPVEKDACMTETLSSVEMECSQMMQKRKKKRLQRTQGSSGDSPVGGQNTDVDKAAHGNSSLEDSDREYKKESVSSMEEMKKKKKKKKKKRRKGLDSPQPTKSPPSQEERIENVLSCNSIADISETGNSVGESVKYVSEAGVDAKSRIRSNTATEMITVHEEGKKREKRKKDRSSTQPAELLASQDEEQLEKIESISCDSQAYNSAATGAVCLTANHVEENEVDAESKKDLKSTQAIESTPFQEGRREKRRRKKDLIVDENSSLATESATLQNGEKKKKKLKKDLNSSSTSDLVVRQEERKEKKKQKKDLNNSNTSDLFTSQEERKQKKKQKKDLNSSNTSDLVALQEERKQKKKQKKDLNGSQTIQLLTSEEEEENRKQKLKKSANSTCLDEADVDADKKKIDANSCQATESNELQEEGKKWKRQKKGLMCLEPSQLLTSPLEDKKENEAGWKMTLEENTNSGCSVSNKTTEMLDCINVDVPIKKDMIPHACKKLLILDVNGLLADLVLHSERLATRKPDLYLRGKSVYRRPYCEDFISFCFENFHVGVWSSRTKKNLGQVVRFLFKGTEQKLIFCWDRAHCTDTGLKTVEDKNKPLVLKELERVWRKVPAERGEAFDASNTLLLDDSPYKALCNPVHTAVFPHSYKCSDAEDSSLGPNGDLRQYLERLAKASNVQEFVSQNPFGQRPITASDPDWAFYRQIIGRSNSKQKRSIQISKTKTIDVNHRPEQHVRFA